MCWQSCATITVFWLRNISICEKPQWEVSCYLTVIFHSCSQLLATANLLSAHTNFPLLYVACKRNYTFCVVFVSGFFSPSPALFSWVAYTVVCVSAFFSFIIEQDPTLLGTAHFIYPVSGWWTLGVVSSLGLLWVILLWTFLYTFGVGMFSFLWTDT